MTGREGQLVRSLAERAASHPWLDLVAAGRPEFDLEQPDSIASVIAAAEPDVVINAAAYTAVDQAEDEPERAMRINGTAAGEIAAAARSAGACVIQVSTDYVFDGGSPVPYDEDAPTGPVGVYGRSKLDGEERVRAADPDHAIIRTAWVYSPFGKNFVKTMMAAAHTRDAVIVVDDQHGNPTSALDLADGLLVILDALRRGDRSGLGQTYHLAGAGEASWYDFACAIFAECARLGLASAAVRRATTADWPTKAVRPANSRLACDRFARQFGYRMPDWRSSVRDVVERVGRGDTH